MSVSIPPSEQVDIREPRFAAWLNAAFGVCLSYQIYPLVSRFRRTTEPSVS